VSCANVAEMVWFAVTFENVCVLVAPMLAPSISTSATW